ncbi:hypothetical protein SAMN05428975_1739 [Mucilaginibacter sp. OK268]|uniref:hypothetical protein n=1 Tax=Mucilaginibacter sp. OK268 TaxID=1881048 RepID=UPI00087FBAA6|nr:hypothetical protein [Mucilaginibacter sp. OK268]SDP54700.1 hypothetical protein SAMN05428975_1739 [Mucilaginibacter sp. OK268]
MLLDSTLHKLVLRVARNYLAKAFGTSNQLLIPLFYVVLHKGPFITNMASEGQFALESIVLAITTGFTWQWSSIVN